MFLYKINYIKHIKLYTFMWPDCPVHHARAVQTSIACVNIIIAYNL